MEINISYGVAMTLNISAYDLIESLKRKHKSIPEDLLTAKELLEDFLNLYKQREAEQKEAKV